MVGWQIWADTIALSTINAVEKYLYFNLFYVLLILKFKIYIYTSTEREMNRAEAQPQNTQHDMIPIINPFYFSGWSKDRDEITYTYR